MFFSKITIFQVVPFILHNDIKITDMKEQTRVLAETWDNTFRVVQNNNSNWANINKVTNWINNNRPKTVPFKKPKISRLTVCDLLTSPITINDIKLCIKNMKKK